jgi:hypothetical protein
MTRNAQNKQRNGTENVHLSHAFTVSEKQTLDACTASLFTENEGRQHIEVSNPLMDLSTQWYQRSTVQRSCHRRMVQQYIYIYIYINGRSRGTAKLWHKEYQYKNFNIKAKQKKLGKYTPVYTSHRQYR